MHWFHFKITRTYLTDNRLDGVFAYCHYKTRFLNFNKSYISVCTVNVLGEPIYTWATTTCREYLLLLDFPAFDSNLCKAGIFLSLTAWIMSWSFTIVPKGNNSPYNVIHRKVNIATFLYTRAMPRRFYITDRNSHTISRLFLQKN